MGSSMSICPGSGEKCTGVPYLEAWEDVRTCSLFLHQALTAGPVHLLHPPGLFHCCPTALKAKSREPAPEALRVLTPL